MTDVQAPDGTIARFPDGMSDADITAVMQKNFPPTAQPGVMAGVVCVLLENNIPFMRPRGCRCAVDPSCRGMVGQARTTCEPCNRESKERGFRVR